MSTPKHTPGPWTDGGANSTAAGERRSICILGPRGERGPRVATVALEGDARLVIAAPELLEALRLAIARSGHSGACQVVGGGGCICWIGDAFAVIAKATGGES